MRLIIFFVLAFIRKFYIENWFLLFFFPGFSLNNHQKSELIKFKIIINYQFKILYTKQTKYILNSYMYNDFIIHIYAYSFLIWTFSNESIQFKNFSYDIKKKKNIYVNIYVFQLRFTVEEFTYYKYWNKIKSDQIKIEFTVKNYTTRVIVRHTV